VTGKESKALCFLSLNSRSLRSGQHGGWPRLLIYLSHPGKGTPPLRSGLVVSPQIECRELTLAPSPTCPPVPSTS